MPKTCTYRYEMHGDTLDLYLAPKCGVIPESLAVRVHEVLNINPGIQIMTVSNVVGMNAVSHAIRMAKRIRRTQPFSTT